jgi:CHASE2 domain-containing sensor protein
MFKKLWLDVIFGTLFIFGLMGMFASVTTFKIFDVFDPVGDALGDFDITDIVFSQFREAPIAEEDILLVNISSLDRAGIAGMVEIINEHNPKVIGIDSFFDYPKEDTLGDMLLHDALAKVENLVLVTKLVPNLETNTVDSVHRSWEYFDQYSDPAYATLITDASEQDDLKQCRSFHPQWEVNGERQVAFGVKLASYLDSAAAEEFLERGYEEELVNFKGNVMDFGATKFGTAFFALDWMDVYNQNFFPELITDKIVMFCYLGEELGDRKSFEDKFITPLNAQYAGRTLPDMYGGVIHANIISSILNRDYVNYMSEVQSYIIGVLLCLVNVLAFTYIYKRLPRWYDGITKLIQLLELAILYIIMIQVFNLYNLKLDLGFGMIAVALAGDSLEVYHGVVKNIFSKKGRKQLFKAEKL